jgi:hypothetical protein
MLLVATLTVLLAATLPTLPARAADPTPLDCPGVIAVSGGYRLTRDTQCELVGWSEDDKFFDLGRHTLTGTVFPTGDRQTLRDGTLVTNGEWWVEGSRFTVLRLDVRPPVPGGCPFFCIEAGDVTVRNSTFRDIGGIALSFFFGPDGGAVLSSTFERNLMGISVQAPDGIRIENNRFVSNGTGVNLFNEDGFGVNANLVRYNTFRRNELGLMMRANLIEGVVTLSHNRIQDNEFLANGRSGIGIDMTCHHDDASACGFPDDDIIRLNWFWGNGFRTTGLPTFDDGVTARSVLETTGGAVDHPAGLIGVRLVGNRAQSNADLGFDVLGVTDGGSNRASDNGNAAQCSGLDCHVPQMLISRLTAAPAPDAGLPQQLHHAPAP